MTAETTTLRIAMNGVTGRMGYRQHLLRSILPIREQGGIRLPDGSMVQVEPILVGRNEAKLAALARQHEVKEWSTDLDTVLSDESVQIYFDSQLTGTRPAALRAAMNEGKHIFTEKPSASTSEDAFALAELADQTGITAGVVHDKLYLPGLVKLRRLVEEGFFGRILALRSEFGYWVFEGETRPTQRPSWNYRLEDDGGITTDMFSHWSYVLEGLIGPVRAVTARVRTHIPERIDEQGQRYEATADDAAYAIFELDDGVIAQMNSSWAVRPYRDELVEFQLDGTLGSAVAGLHACVAQQRAHTPTAVWNPDLPSPVSYRDQWLDVPAHGELDNGFKRQWEEYLTDVVAGRPHRYDLWSAARGVRLAGLGLQSSAEGRRIEVAA